MEVSLIPFKLHVGKLRNHYRSNEFPNQVADEIITEEAHNHLGHELILCLMSVATNM